MLLILEAIFLNGFLIFSTLFQYFFELHCFITHKGTESPTTVIIEQVAVEIDVVTPLCGLAEESPQKVQVVPKEHVEKVQLEKEIVYEVSALSDVHQSFMDTLTADLQLTQAEEVEESATLLVMESPESTPEAVTTKKVAIVDEMLSMDAWKKETEPVAVTPSLASSANATISDFKIGIQNWVVEIVGEEQGFLHVSDGSGRLWVKPKKVNAFARRDIVSLLVNRQTEHRVDVLDAAMLQEYSLDFSMLDEIEHTESLDSETVISA